MKHLLLSGMLLLGGCGGGGSSAGPVPAAPLSAAPPVPHLTTLGDSITAGGAASSPSKAYPALLAAALGAQLTDLGIGGQFTGPYPGHLNASGGVVIAPYPGVLAAEVPNIPLDTTIVTVFIGTNDAWAMTLDFNPTESNLQAVTDAWTAAFQQNFPAIIAGIRARVPNARIIVATVPNPADRPAVRNSLDPWRTAATNFSNAMKATVVATGLPVVDLQCEPALYDDANFPDPINVHPLDAGHAAIAADFLRVIQSPQSVSSCQYGTVLH
jgi:lysophospholipase L1-like esterase